MIQVRRLGHLTFETPDLERQVAYYTEVVGLHAVRDGARAVLATALGEEVVTFERGTAARCTAASFQVAPTLSVAEIGAALRERGLGADARHDLTPNLREAVAFDDPKGTRIELFVDAGLAAPAALTNGIDPVRLGHVAFLVSDAKAITDFYVGMLGFRVSDWMEDFFSFLRCGPDHHTVNFITGTGPSFMHHVAFELEDWAHLERACNVLGRNSRPIIWGPGRHGIGHNVFVYHRDPDDHIIELYAELDQMKDEALGIFEPRAWHHDRPQRPKVWERKAAALTWGTPPTPDFLRNQSRQ